MLMIAMAFLQGVYLTVSGVWPLIRIDSFQRVTGAKTDLWLVKTVGLLLVAIGVGLILASARQAFDAPIVFVAMASAAALLAIELVYVSRRVISPIYLVDAAIEAAFLIGWTVALLYA